MHRCKIEHTYKLNEIKGNKYNILEINITTTNHAPLLYKVMELKLYIGMFFKFRN